MDNDKLQEIEIELQKIEVLIEQLDIKMTTGNKDDYIDQYLELKEQYHNLLIEKKKLKPKGNSIWERIPLWMIIYGLIQFILIGLPYVSWMLWIFFAGILPLQNIELNKFLLTVATYSFPIICLFLSWIVYANFVHKPFEKKVFRYLWIGQTIITILNVIFLYLYIPDAF